jgi:hypothetical protein
MLLRRGAVYRKFDLALVYFFGSSIFFSSAYTRRSCACIIFGIFKSSRHFFLGFF